MKLTREDKDYLLSVGRKEKDFGMIAAAGDKTKYSLLELYFGETIRTVSQEEAIKLLGRDEWLNGLASSSYHQTANVRTADNKYLINFDSSALFE